MVEKKKMIGIIGSIVLATANVGSNVGATTLEKNNVQMVNATYVSQVGLDVTYTTTVSDSINQTYTVKATKAPVDLSKLEIRYYFNQLDDTEINMWCDNAALQLNVAPWYSELTSKVNMSIKKDIERYCCIIKVADKAKLEVGTGSMNISIRMTNKDWTKINNFSEGGLTVLYNGIAISTTTSEEEIPLEDREPSTGGDSQQR